MLDEKYTGEMLEGSEKEEDYDITLGINVESLPKLLSKCVF